MTNVSKKAFMLFVYIVMLAMITSLWASVGRASDSNTNQEPSEIVSQFLENLQQEVIDEFDEKADKLENLLSCVEDESCELADEIIKKYQEYRVYVALTEFNDLKVRLEQGAQGDIVHSGVRLHFDVRSEYGQKEWNNIKQLHSLDKIEIQKSLKKMGLSHDSREGFTFVKDLKQGRKNFYNSVIFEYLSYYPFFGNTTTNHMNRENLKEAIRETGLAFENTTDKIGELEGEDLVELMGFTHAVDKATQLLSTEESHEVISYLTGKNEKTRFLGRLLKIVTNKRTLILATCHIATYTLAVVPNPIVQIARLGAGLLCSSVGITLTVKYFGESTKDILRQAQYGKTHQYDREVLNDYLRSYFTTTVMALLYVIPSLPGLTNRIKGIKSSVDLAKRAHRLKRLSLSPKTMLKFDKSSFAQDVRGLTKSYAVYYGEELAINSLVAAGGSYAGSLMSLEASLIKGVQRGLARSAGVMTYRDFLEGIQL